MFARIQDNQGYLISIIYPESYLLHNTQYETDWIEGVGVCVSTAVGELTKKWKLDGYAGLGLIEFLDRVLDGKESI